MCYPHWYGIGDHRVFVLEISASSLFGGAYPSIATPTTRQLNCKITRVRTKYCKALHHLADQHKMQAKLEATDKLSTQISPQDMQVLHNKWDREWGELMTSAERKCNKFKSCALEFSPTVGQWLRRRAILKWILRWQEGKVPDARNLQRAARRANIKAPLQMSQQEVEGRLHGCMQELFRLRTQAPELRKKHLRWRLALAHQRQDAEATQEINRIIRSEAKRKQQRAINRVVRNPQGRSILSVTVPTELGDYTHTTKAEVEEACGTHLGGRFSLGQRPLCVRDDLQWKLDH
jgi:hypothetical protein